MSNENGVVLKKFTHTDRYYSRCFWIGKKMDSKISNVIDLGFSSKLDELTLLPYRNI